MMSHTLRTQILAGLVGLAAVTAIIVFVLLDAEDQDEDAATTSGAPPELVELEPWPTDDGARALRLRVDPVRGPLWEHGGAQELLTPQSDIFGFDEWQVEVQAGRTRIIGTRERGEPGYRQARAAWTFVEGNPQAHLLLEFEGLSSNLLASTLSLVRDAERADRNKQRLTLWQPAADVSCEEGEEPARFDLRVEQVKTFGGSPGVAAWPYSHGAGARLIPIFDAPRHHPDSELAQSAAEEASGWVSRARTLIYGHSNPDDPRYGNGGLLGHELGGTVVVPSKWVESSAVVELAEALQGTQVELAPRQATAPFPVASTRVLTPPSCRALVELGKRDVPAVVVGSAESGELSLGWPPLPTTVAPVSFDGQLSSLMARGLDPRKLDQMMTRQGELIFSTPFVATRNPLVGAYHEALLKPERDGQWTIATDLSEAMADLELWREEAPLAVTSLANAALYGARSQRVMYWWTDDGSLRVHNPTATTIAGFTLIVPGLAEVEIDEQPVASRQIALLDGAESTLLWWDLEPGTQTLAFTKREESSLEPTAVRWQLDQP